MPTKKYTKELLEPLVADSISMMEVLRKLGLAVNSGGIHTHISRVIKKYGIDTNHFLGARANCGKRHKGGFAKLAAKDILILRHHGGNRTRTTLLRRALIEVGRKQVCYICGIDEWQGKTLVFEIEHKNANPLDDRESNLEFICPNCHSQTDTYCGKNKSLTSVA